MQEFKKNRDISSNLQLNLLKWDEGTFERIYDEYYAPLCLFANKYLQDLDLSRSLVQDFFVEFWIKREKITVKESVKHYLYKSIRNRSIDYLRERKKSVRMSVISESMLQAPFEDKIEEAELNDRINQSISELPEKCKEIFLLCKFEGLKYNQIAEKLGISVKTVEMQMGIALKKLRSKLSDLQVFKLMMSIFLKKNRKSLQGIS